MTEEQKDQLRQKWKRWLNEIGNELGWLLVGRDIYNRLRDIVLSNTKIQSPDTLHKWIIDNYVAKVTTSIRKMVDKKKSCSLHNLISGIKKNPDVITRDYFVSQWGDGPTKENGIASQTFDQFAKVGERCVDANKLETDLKILEKETGLIKDFTDKWVAHWDENRETVEIPSFKDLHNALDIIDEVWRDYNLLLTCSCVPRTRKPGTGDWEAPLRYPWIDITIKEEG